MKCPVCEYTLFNLTSPRCPECGTAFRVTDYQFVPGTVEFGCPHCGQAYQGNGPGGLPSPRQFNCVACGRPVDVDQMRVIPLVDEAVGTAPRMGCAWERPESGSAAGRFFRTVGGAMFLPHRLFAEIRPDARWVRAWWFATLSGWVGSIGMLIYIGFFMLMMGGMTAAAGWGGAGASYLAGMVAGMVAFFIASAPLAALIGGFVISGVVHLFVMMLGANRHGFWATYKAVMYAWGTSVIGLIPACGFYIGVPWMVVSMIFGIRGLHEASGGRAAAIVLVPFGIAVGLYVGLLAIAILA